MAISAVRGKASFRIGKPHISMRGMFHPLSIRAQVFYDNLSPYGQWVEHPTHGYVWLPYAEAGFTPYSTNGHWVYTEYGWTWASNYDWGWALFHYGRWDY